MKPPEQPKPGDGIPPLMCRSCGMLAGGGRHLRQADCIASLRDKIAELEFRLGALAHMGRSGGRRASQPEVSRNPDSLTLKSADTDRVRAHDIPRFVAG
jgi:hypothetical protein